MCNGSPWLTVTYQKSNLSLVGAVAFLMFFFFGCLPDADNCHDNADDTGSSQNVLILAKGEPLTV